MKHILLLTFFISNTLFANYNYKGENSSKIDMHGGKKQKLVEDKQTISNKPFSLGNIGLQKNIDKKEKPKKQNNKN